MQKKLIVLAIAALASTSAFADSSITPYGLVDAMVANVSGDNTRSEAIVLSGGLASSRFGLKGVEDLEGGFKAVGVLEYGVDIGTDQNPANKVTGATASGTATPTVTSTSTKARQQYVGLAGDFGTVVAGYLQTTAYDWENKYDVVAGSQLSPLGNVTKAGGFLIGIQGAAARAQRAVAFITPSIEGLTIAVNYSTQLSDTTGNLGVASNAIGAVTTATLLSGTYDNGPLSVGVVYAATSNYVVTSNVTELAVGASYNIPDTAKITFTYQSSTPNVSGASANTAMSIGAAIPVAAGTVAVSYASDTMSATNSNGSGYSVAYLKPLSKTTTAYLGYSGMSQGTATNVYSVANDAIGGSALAKGGNSSVLALGLQKKF